MSASPPYAPWEESAPERSRQYLPSAQPWQLCRRVLFSSGFSSEQMGVNEFPQVRGFLPKPYRAEQLIAKVSEILGESR